MQKKMEQSEEKNPKIKEQLLAVEVERDRALDELREMKKMAQEANMRLSEALSIHNVKEVNSVNELLSNAKLELKNKEENIELLKVEVGKAKELELKLEENVKNAEANKKVLLSESKERIQELQQKLTEYVKTSESQRKALLSEKEDKIRELELKLAENTETSEAHRKALLSESAERIRKLEVTLAENVETNEAQLKALFCQSEERIRELEMEIDKRRTSEARTLDSLIAQTNQLEQTKVLLEESKFEIDSLQKKLERWEEESVQSSELSTSHVQDSHDTNTSSRDDLESLQSELQLTKENLADSQKKEQIASSKVEILHEEIRALKHELKLTSKAEENVKKAMDDLAIALKEVATEANQLKAALQTTKAELEQSRAQEEHLNLMLKTNEEDFKLVLDEVRKEAERHKNTAARLKIEHEETVLAWGGKETCFVDCIRRAEEDRQATQQENYRLHELLLTTDNKAMLSKEENSKLRDILKQALNEANVAKEAAAIAQLENAQLKDSLEEKEEALNILTQENENYRVNEIAAHENIKELKRLLIESSQKDGKKEEKEKPPLRDVKKESKDKTPTKELKKETKDSKKEFRDKTPTKEDSGKDDKEKTSENKEKEAGTILGKVFSFSLRELKVSHSHDDVVHVVHHDDNDDEIEIDEALKGSIFEVQSPGSAVHHRRTSSAFTEDGEPLHPEDFDHLDGTHAENSRKKKALLRRFGDLIKRSTAYSYTKKEPSPDPKLLPDTKKEPSQDLKKEPSLDSKEHSHDIKKDALPE
ncbi:WEB family protein At5g16730, chloroplastic [Argentina anserina]|uniref:WEB family protein At5g16730, chloroplastic n=1 Tax=Argentina anserina TaxID=57926 RepID=UPI0021762738|nr:WEB family protein At5g16730, chloroplastic [Potentilla anserina]XP_050369520.1 WEB family protein At5g16730, chloroplastic [Potentilla anserina]